MITSTLLGLVVNYFNPEGIPLIREKVELKWAPDSLFLELDKSNPVSIDDSLSLEISEVNKEKDLENTKPKEVVEKQTEPITSEPKKIVDEVKETIAFTEPKAITLDQAYTLFNRDVKFVDARDEADYLAGHITNSINIPFDDFDNHKQKLELLSKEKPMVIYCGGTDCDLSHLLGNLLFEQGYKQVYVFFGGWFDWLSANYPVEYPTE
ncbi:MAG: rhodanese-like domain-containing protein [Ignavibacteriaceae bacterium]|nr:rhodanese-like domain-containing protein [Ignavibacteriaceae bacterium]